MTPLLFFQCFGCGLLGIILHLVVKARSLRNRSLAANKSFSFVAFLKEDTLGILTSVLAVFIFVIGFDELAKYKPAVLDWMKWLFCFVGFTGSSILLAFFSKSEKAILKIIDKKTNIADGKELNNELE